MSSEVISNAEASIFGAPSAENELVAQSAIPIAAGIEVPFDPSASVNKPRLIFQAMRWYGKSAESQYDRANIGNYDSSVRLLADREGFSQFLVEAIGSSGDTLETAAGTGLVSESLHKISSSLTLTDVSEPALEILASRMQGKAEIRPADFLALPFEDGSFDTLVCVGGYRYVKPGDRTRFWSEARRVLKDSGRLFVGEFKPRISPVAGTKVDTDSPSIADHFVLSSKSSYDSKANMGKLNVKSGKYTLYEFATKPHA